MQRIRPLIAFALACSPACGNDGGVSGSASGSASTTTTTTTITPTSTGSTAIDTTVDVIETTTTLDSTSTTGVTAGDSTGADSSSGSTGPVACEDMPELCDAIDNNCNDLYDEGCDCTPPDLELTALDGYTARVIVDVPKDIGNYAYLGDVERAVGDYWVEPGEGVLFTINAASFSAGGIGMIDQDGKFKGWLVDPASGTLPINAYLEYAYDGILYACATEGGGGGIHKVYPDGKVEYVVHHGKCEGLIYGDRGDGVNALYASNWESNLIAVIGADNTRTVLIQDAKLQYVNDLAIPPATSAFKPGLYGINQTALGVHRLDLQNQLSLDFPYTLGYGVGEEMSFADPTSAFRDHFHHLSATLQAVVRVKPDGTWEELLTGPKLKYGLYSTGGVFSSNGAYYFFTNEDSMIMRLQACSVVGQ